MAKPLDTHSPTHSRGPIVALWCATGVWAGLIFFMSSRPGSQLPGGYSGLAHFVEYTMLGILLYGALRTSGTPRAALAALVLASLYGVSDEFHQSFVPFRMPDPMDWALDTVGAATGVALTHVSARFTSRGAPIQGAPRTATPTPGTYESGEAGQ